MGREWSWPPKFLEEVQRLDAGVVAEYAKLGGTRMNEPCPYAVIIDRISHEVPYYRSYLKNAVLQGTTVINNPFMWTADDKFFEASLAAKLGVAHPKTVVLPNKDYVAGIVPNESLRNLIYPLDWKGIIEYTGLPCVLKVAHGGSWKQCVDLLFHRQLIDQQPVWFVDDGGAGIHQVGAVRPLPVHRARGCATDEVRSAGQRRYLVDHEHLSADLGRRIVDDSLKLVRAGLRPELGRVGGARRRSTPSTS